MKRKIVYIWIFLVLVLGLVWYNHQYHCYGYPFLTTPSGLFYKSIGNQGNGKKIQDGEWMEIAVNIKVVYKETEKGKKSSPKEKIFASDSKPYFLLFDQSFQSNNKPLVEMIRMMQEKQRMVFKCSLEYYLKEEQPEDLAQILGQLNLNKEDTVVVDIKLHKIMSDEAYNQMVEANRVAQVAKDKQLITEYLAKHHIEASSTDSGLFYIIDQKSDASPVLKGQTIKVDYTGRLLDGTIFDTSCEEVAKANNLYDAKRSYKPIEFEVGTGKVIKGWDEGLLLLKKGEKARFFIPSSLAYGKNGIRGAIPQDAVLFFEVRVVDVH